MLICSPLASSISISRAEGLWVISQLGDQVIGGIA